MDLKRIHYLSGFTLTIFIGAHLFNHIMSLFGVGTHVLIMDKLRVVYRHPAVESILLLAVLLQILSGLRLFFRKRNYANLSYDRLQLWSGMYLAIFLLIHVSAVLGGRLLLHLDTNFYFGVAGLNTYPYSLFFIPYYSLAIMSFFGHVAAIHHQKMKFSVWGMTPEVQSKLILLKGVIATIIILYGLTDGFYGITIPEEFDILIGR